MITEVAGLKDLIDHFDLFLIDQYGVLHDGRQPYAHAVEALEFLREQNKEVVIVSNSGKRSDINVQRMKTLGFEDTLFERFVTSGEVAFNILKDLFADKETQKCYLISRDGDTSAIDGLDVVLTDTPEEADLIVISASEGDRFEEKHYAELLNGPAAKNTLCLCTNPDKIMLTANGLKFGAGRIAELYEEQGGSVVWIGKPYPSIYTHILSTTSAQHIKDRTLCIGDSIEHDIAGGKNNGLNTLLVKTGIAFDYSQTELNNQFDYYGVSPDYIASELRP